MQEMENTNKDDKVPTSRAELGIEILNSQCNEQKHHNESREFHW